ncbi:MAG: hypothetical protein K6D97_04205 [Clostridia bacterium]|nr:hypothetical protein [Clostridia bacterium]
MCELIIMASLMIAMIGIFIVTIICDFNNIGFLVTIALGIMGSILKLHIRKKYQSEDKNLSKMDFIYDVSSLSLICVLCIAVLMWVCTNT